MLRSFENLGCNMSIKVYCLYTPIDHFQYNLVDISEKQGKRFLQDITIMENK